MKMVTHPCICRSDQELNRWPSSHESNALTTRLPSHRVVFGNRWRMKMQLTCWNNTTTTTTVLRPFVRDYPGEPVPEETLTHPPYWWLSNLYQLIPSTTIHSILLVQITCLAMFLHNLFHVLFGLPLGLEPSTSYSIHFFTQSVSSRTNGSEIVCKMEWK